MLLYGNKLGAEVFDCLKNEQYEVLNKLDSHTSENDHAKLVDHQKKIDDLLFDTKNYRDQ